MEKIIDPNLRIKELQLLINADKKNPWYHFELAQLLELTEPQKALEEYNLSIKLDPHIEDFHYKKALLLQRLGKLDEAIKALEWATVIDYQHALFYYYVIGSMLDEEGRFEEAIKAYKKALIKDPNNEWLIEAIVLDLLELGRKEEALQFLDEAITKIKKEELVNFKREILRIK
ncbi:tetratricopeptide repeat protein [Sulfurisphaera ohwakuensis]|uniref:Tetratricopeptide (TPR) repeat protein n=1 Tax=Sulfurisphaera ohwakuensis TaxID=69656 RepID=A0A650CG97_SULOH|nr:tetratricopeptide repeat protein [Sulfurisphaera ohwakuensis]MBB5252705.1 tetratricopeptide (TPR) repeat protein [Sulfurisphaera ohwakuensis]QGR16874.1 tetratricopeptide repeat protein [Sulfurisphaera ohwakuensis]